MMILSLVFGLTAMFALLGVAAWLWFRDPVWPWTRPIERERERPNEGPPAHAAIPQPVAQPLPQPLSTGGDQAEDRTMLEAVAFPEPDPADMPAADKTQILPDQGMLDQIVARAGQ